MSPAAPGDSPRRWVFLRHGQSEANAARRLAGWVDSPLTELGRQQARAAGLAMAQERFVRVLSSDLVRASETARLALESWSRHTGLEAPPLALHRDLRERNLGSAQGLTMAESRASGVMDCLISWDRRPSPEGESNELLARRLLPALEALGEVEGTTLVVAHGGVIRVLLGLIDGAPRERIGLERIANCEPHVRELSEGTWARLRRSLAG